ncbi:MAG: formylglycine-generating enzyme family protein [Gammaproteobacteria bacterium]|nr:MAG: formylglycine-generating enzyme family protein [Gammaproteobacteria bacterium]
MRLSALLFLAVLASQAGAAPFRVFQDTLKDGTKGPEMVVIPEGTFLMGSPPEEVGRDEDEGPRHRVTFKRPFAIGRFEITFEEYDRFCKATGRTLPSDSGWGRGRRPAFHVSFEDAKAYVRWLSKETGKRYRLPSEAEWEYAARGGTDTPFWWGTEMEEGRANCRRCSPKAPLRTLPVGSFPPNPFGLYDTAGNLYEWVEDCYHPSYEGAPEDGRAWVEEGCDSHVTRGGAWNVGPVYLRSANRSWVIQGFRDNDTGFRVARDL